MRLVCCLSAGLYTLHEVLRIILGGLHLMTLDLHFRNDLLFHFARGLSLRSAPLHIIAILQLLRHDRSFVRY